MRFRDGLMAARSHIVFVLALLSSTALVLVLEGYEPDPARRTVELRYTEGIPTPEQRPATAEEKSRAAVAWRYFAANSRAETGVADTVAGFPVASLWNVGSQMLAVLSAERLGMVPWTEAEKRLAQVVATLRRLPLFDESLPNRFFNTVTLAPVDRDGRTDRAPLDLGWSAVDLGRLLVALDAAVRTHPNLSAAAADLLSHWKVDRAIADRRLQAAILTEQGKPQLHQEGRLGWEEYAARGFALWGYDAARAMEVEPDLGWATVAGVEVPVDVRPFAAESRTHVISEPWLATGLEFGLDRLTAELAWRVLAAQERRFKETGKWTAVAEGPLDREPLYAQSTLYADGTAWKTIAGTEPEPDRFRIASTKAAFGWEALFGTEYARRLLGELSGGFDAGKGWFAGRYEASGAANTALGLETNAMVLMATAYKAHGPLVRAFRTPAPRPPEPVRSVSAPKDAGPKPAPAPAPAPAPLAVPVPLPVPVAAPKPVDVAPAEKPADGAVFSPPVPQRKPQR